MLSFAALGAAGDAAQLAGGSRAASMDRCVEDTGFMRKYHMEVLLHQRDLTMRQGVRTRDHSLVECVACHAGRDDDGNFVAVNARDGFCAGCHNRAAVDIDCFQCHATRPDADARIGSSARAEPLPATARLYRPGMD